MTAITAITAQNTTGVRSVHAVPPESIVDQVRAVAEDIGVDAVKIGMLGSVDTIEAVEHALDLAGDVPVVLDPVMVAESGAVLLHEDARRALRKRLLPRATVATPNLSEARVLAEAGRLDGGPGGAAPDLGAAREAADGAGSLARAVHALGPDAVVVTGGHRAEAADVFFDGARIVAIPGNAIPTAPPTGRAALTPRRWLRSSPAGPRRSTPRAPPERWRRPPFVTGYEGSARGRDRSTPSTSRGGRASSL